MSKSYFNQMICGNSEMLGCIDERGELIRLFWPDIDYPQHIDRLTAGITCADQWYGTSWLNGDDWKVTQHYIEDTNAAVTSYMHRNNCLLVSQTDFATPGRPVLERYYEILNTGSYPVKIGFMVYSSSVAAIPDTAGVLFDTGLSALIHYRHGYYYGIASNMDAAQYQLGGDAYGNAGQARLTGSDTIGMMRDGALQWEEWLVEAGGRLCIPVHICLAHELKGVKALIQEMKCADTCKELENCVVYWSKYLAEARQIHTGKVEIDCLYRRSLLVFALMTNKRTGGLLAAPEVDEEFTRCGRYAYCWGRDAAFITAALDICGLSDDVDAFWRWAAMVQDVDGSWQQRYHLDGNLGPSWGLQIDEGGSIIHGILKHYEYYENKELLKELWPCVKKGVEFLLSYIDEETGLPWLSFDLWEERLGEHAYSTAAVCAGIEAGAGIAKILEACGAIKADGAVEAAGAGSVEATGAGAVEADGAVEATGAVEAAGARSVEAAGAAQAESPEQAGGSVRSKSSEQTGVSLAARWMESAAKLRAAMERNFWKPEWDRFVRSVRVKLNGWGEEHTTEKVWLKLNNRSVARDFTMLDGTVDISLLGLSVPFGIYFADDPRMVSTARTVEQVLQAEPAGGLMRYEHDGYIGGNPWIIATLWAALYHLERKSYEKAKEYFDWAIKGTTEQGLLPEQIGRATGKPAWVIPLTWSHAMFVLVLDGLIGVGIL